MLTAEVLPITGVKISMLVFGGLTLLILGGAFFFASQAANRRKRPSTPPNQLLMRGGFKPGPTGQPDEEGGNQSRPDPTSEG